MKLNSCVNQSINLLIIVINFSHASPTFLYELRNITQTLISIIRWKMMSDLPTWTSASIMNFLLSTLFIKMSLNLVGLLTTGCASCRCRCSVPTAQCWSRPSHSRHGSLYSVKSGWIRVVRSPVAELLYISDWKVRGNGSTHCMDIFCLRWYRRGIVSHCTMKNNKERRIASSLVETYYCIYICIKHSNDHIAKVKPRSFWGSVWTGLCLVVCNFFNRLPLKTMDHNKKSTVRFYSETLRELKKN